MCHFHPLAGKVGVYLSVAPCESPFIRQCSMLLVLLKDVLLFIWKIQKSLFFEKMTVELIIKVCIKNSLTDKISKNGQTDRKKIKKTRN